MEAHDLSPLAPMSVRDLIWVNIAQARNAEFRGKNESELWKACFQTAETIYLAICDCRELAMDTNLYVRCSARIKGGKITGYDPKKLPSNRIEEERQEAERRAKMTPEELAEQEVKDFLSGKSIKPH